MPDNLIKVSLMAHDIAVTPARASQMAWLATTLLEATGTLPLCRLVGAVPAPYRDAKGLRQQWVVTFEPATQEEIALWVALGGNKHLDTEPFTPALVHASYE